MGIWFIIMIENVLKKTEKEIEEELVGKHKDYFEWTIYKYKGKEYAYWDRAPRFFDIEDEPEMWEGMRKYLVRAMNFFGSKEVLMTVDVAWFGLPFEDESEERDGYYLPHPIPEEYLKEPDYEKNPKLKEIKELQGLYW